MEKQIITQRSIAIVIIYMDGTQNKRNKREFHNNAELLFFPSGLELTIHFKDTWGSFNIQYRSEALTYLMF